MIFSDVVLKIECAIQHFLRLDTAIVKLYHFFRRCVQISKKKYQKILEINQLALLHKPSCERLICCRYAGLRNLLGINPLSTKIFNINEEILTGLIYQKRF